MLIGTWPGWCPTFPDHGIPSGMDAVDASMRMLKRTSEDMTESSEFRVKEPLPANSPRT